MIRRSCVRCTVYSVSAPLCDYCRAVDCSSSRSSLYRTVFQDKQGAGRMIEIDWYLALSAVLFTIGVIGVLIRRNAIVILMCVELMLNAVNISLISFSSYHGDITGQILVFFVLAVAAAEAVVGLAIIIAIFRNNLSLDISKINLLRW